MGLHAVPVQDATLGVTIHRGEGELVVDSATLAWTLLGISAGGYVGIAIAWMSGAIVAGSRATEAETAARILREAYDTLKIPVEKFDIESDLVGAVLRANHAVATGATPPPLPPTTHMTG